jgi:hypothetical protein
VSWEHLHDVIRLAPSMDLADAHVVQRALQDDGIDCMVLTEYFDVENGNALGRAGLWVATADWLRADTHLRQFAQRPAGRSHRLRISHETPALEPDAATPTMRPACRPIRREKKG